MLFVVVAFVFSSTLENIIYDKKRCCMPILSKTIKHLLHCCSKAGEVFNIKHLGAETMMTLSSVPKHSHQKVLTTQLDDRTFTASLVSCKYGVSEALSQCAIYDSFF